MFGGFGITNVKVVGDRSIGCVWLDLGEHKAALWPPSYWARFDPVRIYDEKGTETWREGQPREIGAAGTRDPRYVERIPKQCRVGESAEMITSIDEPRSTPSN